ncbi:polysaccharide pyruvyl transferase family protein [bacterium]|nr:polysaccharide pyruvyl transferase family protein [bacterium]
MGTPNFGDDFNPLFFSKVMDRRVRLSRRRGDIRILGMGSILSSADGGCHVAGSGLLDPALPPRGNAEQVVALRGELSASKTGWRPEYLGDPAVLLPLVYDCEKKARYRFGFLPHHREAKVSSGHVPDDWLFINPAWPPLKVLESICGCERLVSRSLHGLILADAYQIPNAWIHPLPEMTGGIFKYEDYYSTMNHAKLSASVPLTRLGADGPALDFFVSQYRFEKPAYLARLRNLASSFGR